MKSIAMELFCVQQTPIKYLDRCIQRTLRCSRCTCSAIHHSCVITASRMRTKQCLHPQQDLLQRRGMSTH